MRQLQYLAYFNIGYQQDAEIFNLIDENDGQQNGFKKDSIFESGFAITGILFYRFYLIVFFSLYLLIWSLGFILRWAIRLLSPAIRKLFSSVSLSSINSEKMFELKP